MSDTRHRADWFRRLRAEWFRVMRPEGSWVPWELRDLVELPEAADEPSFWGEGLLTKAPQLGEEHVRSCVVVPTREALLARLPRGGVVAEVGVSHGDFSRTITDVVSPAELHLIDHVVEPGMRAVERAGAGRVHIHQGDSADTLATFADGYIPWSYVEMQPYGVVAAVNELCLNDGWEMVYLALPAHMYCDVALRRRA